MRAGMTELQAANQMLEAASPDLAAYGAKVKEAAQHMAEGHIAMAKAAVEARTVLTPQQLRTMTDLMARMHKGSNQ
jgi:Spy/CpxP family protein refolding chaperone